MRNIRPWQALPAGLFFLWTGCSTDATAPSPTGDPEFTVTRVASGFEQPVHVTSAPADERLFVVERDGRIRTLRNGQIESTDFLDLRSRVGTGGERGLLSVAFSPDFATTRELFVNFTGLSGETRVERLTVGAAGSVDAASAELVLSIAQPASNHNGGMIQFGPDGYLYVGMGDGGGANDQFGHGQDPSTLLGSMLRLDVRGAVPYAIPPDNPFVGETGARPEIWAIGLRNPWRFSFDEAGGMLYVADVGQNRIEEINADPVGEGGIDYGWSTMEGSDCFSPASGCHRSGLTLPVAEYDHSEGCSVTGGVVYRGDAVPSLTGHYLYADFCAGILRSFRLDDGAAADEAVWTGLGSFGNVTSFGTGPDGEVYFVTLNGDLFQIAAVEP